MCEYPASVPHHASCTDASPLPCPCPALPCPCPALSLPSRCAALAPRPALALLHLPLPSSPPPPHPPRLVEELQEANRKARTMDKELTRLRSELAAAKSEISDTKAHVCMYGGTAAPWPWPCALCPVPPGPPLRAPLAAAQAGVCGPGREGPPCLRWCQLGPGLQGQGHRARATGPGLQGQGSGATWCFNVAHPMVLQWWLIPWSFNGGSSHGASMVAHPMVLPRPP